MKCGHPDEMDNLYWNRMEDTDHISTGGVWVCRTCNTMSSRRFKSTIPGILARERNRITENAKRRHAQ